MDDKHAPSPVTPPARQPRALKARYYVLFILLGCLAGFAVYTYKFRPFSRPHTQTPIPPTSSSSPVATDQSPIRAQILVHGDPSAHMVYSDPQWSPGGRAIAYVSLSSAGVHDTFTSGDLYLAEFKKGQWSHRLLQSRAGWPLWSPDGAKLACHLGGLSIIDIATNQVRLLEADSIDEKDETGNAYHYPVSWSSDGRFLLYETAYWEGGGLSLFDFKLNTSKTLTSGKACWMADGRLFNVDDDGYGGDEKNAKISVYDPLKHTSRLLKRGFDAHDPYILKDGKSGYLLRNDNENSDQKETVYRIDIATGKLTTLAKIQNHAWSWSPDGTRFAAIGSNDAIHFALYLGSTTNWKPVVLKSKAGPISGNWHDRMKYVSWSPDGAWITYITENGDIEIVKAGGKE